MFRILLLIALSVTTVLHSLAGASTSSDAVHLLTEARTQEQLDAAVVKAKRAGVSSQQLTEAKLLFGIKNQDSTYLVSLIPELEAAASSFTTQPSLAGISSVEQWRGLIAYARAMGALDLKNQDRFREQVSEGVWSFPQQAELFGQLVEKFQLQQKMDQWVIDFSTPLLESGGAETTLGALIGSKKALLLVFWSGDAEPSLQALSVAQKLHDHLKTSGVVVAAVNAGTSDPEAITEKVRADKQLTLPCLIESNVRTLVRQIEITSLPRAVLITQQGRIFFHGHPMDQSIWKALKRVVPTILPLGN